MPSLVYDELPDVQKSIKARPLFVMKLDVRPLQNVGETPAGVRRVGVVFGGQFAGDRLSGEVLDGGADWQIQRPDGALTLDVRLVLKANDGAPITMAYRGLRAGATEILRQIDQGVFVDPATYYFRTCAMFETASPKYDWLNRILAVGVGSRTKDGPVYSIFELL